MLSFSKFLSTPVSEIKPTFQGGACPVQADSGEQFHVTVMGEQMLWELMPEERQAGQMIIENNAVTNKKTGTMLKDVPDIIFALVFNKVNDAMNFKEPAPMLEAPIEQPTPTPGAPTLEPEQPVQDMPGEEMSAEEAAAVTCEELQDLTQAASEMKKEIEDATNVAEDLVQEAKSLEVADTVQEETNPLLDFIEAVRDDSLTIFEQRGCDRAFIAQANCRCFSVIVENGRPSGLVSINVHLIGDTSNILSIAFFKKSDSIDNMTLDKAVRLTIIDMFMGE